MGYIYTIEYYSAIKKEWNFAICSNVDGPWGHYAKWNKSDRERQILYDHLCVESKKKKNSLIQRTDWWLLEAAGVGWWEVEEMGEQFLFLFLFK